MNPIDFPQANRTLSASNGASEVPPLRVWTDGNEVISCWQPNDEQRRKIAAGEPVFLCVTGMGGTMPPVWLDAGSPFVDPQTLRKNDAETLRELGIAP